MKLFLQFLTVILCIISIFEHQLFAQELSHDFIAEISAYPDIDFGLEKLSAEEKAKLNDLFNAIFQSGIRAGSKDEPQAYSSSATETEEKGLQIAYRTIIDTDDGKFIKLINGAEIKIISDYPCDVGFKKNAILYYCREKWKILIDGKGPLECTISKMPVYGAPYSARELTIKEIKGDCSALVMEDGSVYEPKNIYPMTKSIWERYPRGLLLNGYELINLGEGNEKIEVKKVL